MLLIGYICAFGMDFGGESAKLRLHKGCSLNVWVPGSHKS